MKKLILVITLLSINSFCLLNAALKSRKTVVRKTEAAKPSQKGTCNFYAFKSKDESKAYFVTECNIK